MRFSNIVLAGLLASAGLASDGHAAWQSVGAEGAGVMAVVGDRDASGRVYMLSNNGSYLSHDHGEHWTRLGGGVPFHLGGGGLSGSITMVFSGADMYVADSVCTRLFRSSDDGRTWVRHGTLPAGDACFTGMVRTRGADSRFLLMAPSGLHASDDGVQFDVVPDAFPPARAVSLKASPSQDGVVFAIRTISGSGIIDIHRSGDSGATWSLVTSIPAWTWDGLTTPALVFGPGQRVHLLMRFANYRSDDGGVTWSSNLGWGGILAAAHPTDAQVVYAVDDAYRVMMSSDGGASFGFISGNEDIVGPAGRPTITTLTVLPRADGHDLLVGTLEAGAFRLSEGQWRRVNDGLEAPIRNVVVHPSITGYAVASSEFRQGIFRGPLDDGLVEAGSIPRNLGARAIAFDPTSGNDPAASTVFAGGSGHPQHSSGLWKSTDGGEHWIDVGLTDFGPGSTLGMVREIVLDPRSCENPPPAPAACTTGPLRTLYATGVGMNGGTHRVIKSIDGGMRWSDIDTLPRPPVNAGQTLAVVPIVVDPVDTQTLYVGTSWSGAVATPTVDSGVFRSTDGGATWSLRSTGLPLMSGTPSTHHSIYAIAIDPSNPSRLWAASSGAPSGGGDSTIYRSDDGGAQWMPSSSGITAGDIRSIAVDPVTPSTLYAAAVGRAGHPAGVYRSIDGGVTWRSISVGLRAEGVLSVAVDRSMPSTVAAGGTRGVSMLTLEADADADGVPDTVEQAGPGGGDANGDGIPDHLQAHVASIDASAVSGRWHGGGAVEQGAGMGRVVIEVQRDAAGTCAQLVDAQVVDPADRLLDIVDGERFVAATPLVRFEILDCPSADVIVSWPGSASPHGAQWRFHGASAPGSDALGWHDFSSQAVDLGGGRWRLRLAAGGFGSYRPASSQAILFEGALSVSDDRLFSDGFDPR